MRQAWTGTGKDAVSRSGELAGVAVGGLTGPAVGPAPGDAGSAPPGSPGGAAFPQASAVGYARTAGWVSGLRAGRARRLFEWEYRDLTIPIGIVGPEAWHREVPDDEDPGSRRFRARQALAAQVGRMVELHLRRAGQDGWEPTHATDWVSLCREGRVRVAQSEGPWHTIYRYESATIRLRRLANLLARARWSGV